MLDRQKFSLHLGRANDVQRFICSGRQAIKENMVAFFELSKWVTGVCFLSRPTGEKNDYLSSPSLSAESIHCMEIVKQINKWLIKPLTWIVWDLTGIHAIFIKIFPPSKSTIDVPDYKPPPVFGLWLLSIYFACLGFATARYERILDRAEFKYNTLTTQLAAGVPFNKTRIDEIGELEIPQEPKFELRNFNFIVSVWGSLFAEKEPYFRRHSRIYLDKGKRVNAEIDTIDEFLLMMVEHWKHKLSGASLAKANLKGASLSDAILADAHLDGANFENAILIGAKLGNADLTQANFAGANLNRANLEKASLHKTNLTGVTFTQANLSGAIFKKAVLPAANLEKANLNNVIFEDTNLEGALLWEANLEGTKFLNSNLARAEFYEAKIKDTTFLGFNLEGAGLAGLNLAGTSLGYANLTGADLYETNLERADLSHAILRDADLQRANLDHATLLAAKLENANLEEASLAGANLSRAILTRAKLGYTNLKYAKFYFARLEKVDLGEANLSGVNFGEAFILGSKLRTSDFGSYPQERIIQRLSRAATLHHTELPFSIEEKMKELYPELFDKPPDGAGYPPYIPVIQKKE